MIFQTSILVARLIFSIGNNKIEEFEVLIRSLIVATVLMATAHAKTNSLEDFFKSFKSELHLLNIDRGLELDHHIRIKNFSALDKILSPDASATYNGKLNTVKLEEGLLSKKGSTYAIKAASEILGPKYMGSTSLVTIFHELGHAEMDVFVENQKSVNDVVLLHQYKAKIKDLFKRNFSGNTWTIFHEYFAYYRTDLLELIIGDKQNIYMMNGFIPDSGRCYLTNHLKKMLADGASLEEFSIFHALYPEKNYMKETAPRYIFVRGKDFELSKLSLEDKKIIDETNKMFWMYHYEAYGFPLTQKVLVDRMNRNDSKLESLKNCRKELFAR